MYICIFIVHLFFIYTYVHIRYNDNIVLGTQTAQGTELQVVFSLSGPLLQKAPKPSVSYSGPRVENTYIYMYMYNTYIVIYICIYICII